MVAAQFCAQGEKAVRAGSVNFAEKCIFPKIYFSNFFGLKDTQLSSQCQKTGNRFPGMKNNEGEICYQFGPAEPNILMAASFEK
jgi:hypothetical protein